MDGSHSIQINDAGVIVAGHEVLVLPEPGRPRAIARTEIRLAEVLPGLWAWAYDWNLSRGGEGHPLTMDWVAPTREEAIAAACERIRAGLASYARFERREPCGAARAVLAWLEGLQAPTEPVQADLFGVAA